MIETQTLKKMYTQEAFAAEFSEIDSATAEALYKSFSWRNVCDNDYFAEYFHTLWYKIGQQYNDLLHIQLTRIDPMVTKYLERQLKHGGTDKRETSQKTDYNSTMTDGKGVTTRTTYGHTISDDKGTTDTITHNTTDTETRNTQDKTEYGRTQDTTHGETITESGTDTTSTKNNQTRTDSRTDNIADRTTDTSGTSSGVSSSDNRGMSASLPQVESYTASGFPAPATIATAADGTGTATGVLASSMDWRNADSQTESAGLAANSGKTSGSSKTTVGGADTSRTETAYTGTADTAATEYGRKDTHSGTDNVTDGGSDTLTGTGTNTTTKAGTDETAHTGTDKQTHGGTDVTTQSGDDTHAHTGNDNVSGSDTSTYGSYDRERYTGHDGNPAELLQKAAEYVRGTAAFSWLCRRVDHLFIDVYDY